MKRIIALVLVLIMAMGIVVEASAASYPRVSIQASSRNQAVKRGDKVYFYFNLDSGSFGKKGGVYRTRFEIYIYKGKTLIAEDAFLFSGRGIQPQYWKVKKAIRRVRTRFVTISSTGSQRTTAGIQHKKGQRRCT